MLIFLCFRAYNLARDYAHRRKAFGKRIIDWPLHTQTLARIDQVSKASFLLAFEVFINIDYYYYSDCLQSAQCFYLRLLECSTIGSNWKWCCYRGGDTAFPHFEPSWKVVQRQSFDSCNFRKSRVHRRTRNSKIRIVYSYSNPILNLDGRYRHTLPVQGCTNFFHLGRYCYEYPTCTIYHSLNLIRYHFCAVFRRSSLNHQNKWRDHSCLQVCLSRTDNRLIP